MRFLQPVLPGPSPSPEAPGCSLFVRPRLPATSAQASRGYPLRTISRISHSVFKVREPPPKNQTVLIFSIQTWAVVLSCEGRGNKNTFCRYKQSVISCVIPLMLFTHTRNREVLLSLRMETQWKRHSWTCFRVAGTRKGEWAMYWWGTWRDSHRLLSSCSSVYHRRCSTLRRCCKTTASRGFRTKTKHFTQWMSPNNAITPNLLWKRTNIEALAPPQCMMGFSFFPILFSHGWKFWN